MPVLAPLGILSSGFRVVYLFRRHQRKKLLEVERMVISVFLLRGLSLVFITLRFARHLFLYDISMAFWRSPSVSSSILRLPTTGRI